MAPMSLAPRVERLMDILNGLPMVEYDGTLPLKASMNLTPFMVMARLFSLMRTSWTDICAIIRKIRSTLPGNANNELECEPGPYQLSSL